jgi:DNA-binding transcriptional regulator YdaS (Cro superfamily)
MASTAEIIERFGGQSALARLIGKGPSTVQYWAKADRIPAKWQTKLLELAQEHGIRLEPQELGPQAPATPGDELERIPEALWAGILPVGSNELPVYVLDDGRRVLSRTGATASLTGVSGGGDLESYISVAGLQDFLPQDIENQLIEFTLRGVKHKTVRGITANTFLSICRAYVAALQAEALQTDRQRAIAAQAAMFLAACADVGLDALIDEATGYQLVRPEDALRIKLNLYLEEEMRQWEKTFPDELWAEFGRLTNWRGATNSQRPKYWGKLVNELIYDYLDPDVAQWLRTNAPKPRHGQNYHQWLSSQYGLKKLTEHMWMVIGMARACNRMWELRQRMAEQFGKQPIQLTMFVDMPMRQRLGLPRGTEQEGQLDTEHALELLEREGQ